MAYKQAGMAGLRSEASKGTETPTQGFKIYQVRVYGIYKKIEKNTVTQPAFKRLREARVGVLRQDRALVDIVADLCYDDELIYESLNN